MAGTGLKRRAYILIFLHVHAYLYPLIRARTYSVLIYAYIIHTIRTHIHYYSSSNARSIRDSMAIYTTHTHT
jgi:hypothetical protein